MFDRAAVPAHLRMNVIVTDADGTVHDADDDLGAIKRRLAATAREAIAAAAPIDERRGIVTWDVGTLPQVVVGRASRASPRPATRRCSTTTTSVSLRVLTNADLQQRVMRGGVRRLLLLTAAPSTRDVLKGLTGAGRLAIAGSRRRPRRARRATARSPPSTTCCAEHDAAVGRRRVRRAAARRAARGAGHRRRCAGRGPPTCSSRRRRSASACGRLDRAGAAALGRRRRRPTSTGSCGRGSCVVAGTRRASTTSPATSAAIDVPPRPPRRRRRPRPPPDGRGRPARGRLRGAAAARRDRPRVVELGWRLEELRVSVFAQPIGAKGAVSATKLRRELADAACPDLIRVFDVHPSVPASHGRSHAPNTRMARSA